MEDLPFSQACANNQQPIFEVLSVLLQQRARVLEIGSGTGQHSVYFAPRLPHLLWQTSDVPENHAAIHAWHRQYPADNLYAPLPLNLTSANDISQVTTNRYDAVFTANTLHIVPWALVLRLFEVAASVLPTDGVLIVYGPFNENGSYTSTGNQRFDISLRQRDPKSGIRHKEDIVSLANTHHLTLSKTYAMPANNQLLVFQKH